MNRSRSAEHRANVASMFARIASSYDKANHILSIGVDKLWRKRLTREVERAFQPGSRRLILDMAAGTLDLSFALVRSVPGAKVLAVDFCLPMLQNGFAKRKNATAYERGRIALACGDGLNLPLADASVDAVTVAFGLRNMHPRSAAIHEAFRVLVPGGAFHILEFGSARGLVWGGIYNVYLTKILPYIGGLISGEAPAYQYLAHSVTGFPDAPALGEELEAAGFATTWKPLWGGVVYIHTGIKKKTASVTRSLPKKQPNDTESR